MEVLLMANKTENMLLASMDLLLFIPRPEQFKQANALADFIAENSQKKMPS